MPNWCYNRVEICGEPEEMDEFRELVKSKKSAFDFNEIIPMPKELEDSVSGSENSKPDWQKERSKELIEKYGADNWYRWCCDNWGVKWNVTLSEEQDVQDEGDYLQYTFDTAWGPPDEIFYALRRKFPDVSISWFYDEPGMQFAGYLNE